ncbi:MAG TPA: 2-amino-4-hydroxy-6-hydroxymethyldihydropteridine diphosphokinase [Planctomycetaceae bacterium]|nr:2-amino-4-hydroxy-6-hydroxymethyldihydropteridine diphosphokinase [Planctomycetaceae bacterium]
MVRCYVALGGNVGPVEQTFDRTLAELGADPRLVLGPRSSARRTRAVGARSGGDFLNAAVELHADLPPLELLEVLQELEARHGRTRRGEGRWTPRTLDLDLLLYGEQVIDLPGLRVPHPACWYRRFVLDALAEIAGDVVHPEKGATIRELRERLLVRPLPAALAGGDTGLRQTLIQELSSEFVAATVNEWPAAARTEAPALLFWLGEPRPSGPETGAPPAAGFDELPAGSRLDVSQAADAAQEVRDVLTSALG